MDSLKVQDVFEPYYAGRKGAAVPGEKRLFASIKDSLARERVAIALPTNVRLSDNKQDSTTEH